VTCSATIFGEKGNLIRVDFLHEGRETSGAFERESPSSISHVWVPLTAEPKLPEGDYVCHFWLDGEQAGENRFMITR
jgi:hypothetical protein